RVVSGLLHLARSTSGCDLPDPIPWSVSAAKYSRSAWLPRCYPFSLRSPFYLCFDHVDNLGAYTASRTETALLISSIFSYVHLVTFVLWRKGDISISRTITAARQIVSQTCLGIVTKVQPFFSAFCYLSGNAPA